MKTIAAMYFALTSLSTVGFGDLYPRNDYERLLGSIMLLGGVTCFSYVLNELSYMMSNIKFLNGEFNDKEELEKFFVMLQKFNDGQLINHELQTRVAEFMGEKWSCDKNNFLITDHDQMLLDQLPFQSQTQIYTKFLFRDFLWKFRRLFNFKKFGSNGYPYFGFDDEIYNDFMK